MPFRFLDHTADIQIECDAPDFPALLVAAAQALYAVALTEQAGRVEIEQRIALEAASREDLLVRWLQELLFLLDTEEFVGVAFDVHAGPCALQAVVGGYRCMPAQRAEEVKSATYHELTVQTTDGGWQARFILDV